MFIKVRRKSRAYNALCVRVYVVLPDDYSSLNSQPKNQRSWEVVSYLASLPVLESQCSRRNFVFHHTYCFILYSPFNLSCLCFEFLLYWFCSLLPLMGISFQLLYFNFFPAPSSFPIFQPDFFHLSILASFMLRFKRTCMLIENILTRVTSFS